MSDLSAGDILAMTRNNNEGFLEGNGIIILILFLLLFSGNGFGNGNWGGNAAMQGSLTRAEMQDGFNNQNLVNSFNNLAMSMNNGFNANTLAMNNGFNGVQASLANLGFQMQNCCCETKQQIQLQGDLTRQLINNNTMQDLRDRLEEKDRQLNAAIFTNSQQLQTRTIEDFILANQGA